MSDDLRDWRKSKRSFSLGNCAEVGQGRDVIGVRDTKLAQSPVLTFSGDQWTAFIARLKSDIGG